MADLNFETLATHAGYSSKEGCGSMAVPIYLTTAFDFGTSEEAAARFALQSLGPIYTRLNNPTVDIFEARIAALEGGVGAIGTASGQAASFYAVANVASAGDNIIMAQKVYGGTSNLMLHTLKKFGIETRVFDADSANDLESLIDSKTKAIFVETLSNPQVAIPNFYKIIEIADKYGIISIVDNTVATPVLFNPIKKGADVVIHSASKYISGQGLTIAGAVVSGASTNKKIVGNPRYADFNEPDESYHGLVYTNLVENFDIFTLRIRLGLLRDIGATMSPFSAWQLIQGLETLSVRVKEHSRKTQKIAEFLESHPAIKSVNYPGLKSSPLNKFVQENFTDGLASGLLCFDAGSREIADAIMREVKIFAVVVNIGDSKSVITHPASSTHSQSSDEELLSAGITPGLIRLSVGLEDTDDLINDLKNAIEKAIK